MKINLDKFIKACHKDINDRLWYSPNMTDFYCKHFFCARWSGTPPLICDIWQDFDVKINKRGKEHHKRFNIKLTIHKNGKFDIERGYFEFNAKRVDTDKMMKYIEATDKELQELFADMFSLGLLEED